MATTRRHIFPLAICGAFLTFFFVFFAIVQLKRLKPQDPEIDAKLYAASKNAAQYVAGDQSEANIRRGQAALEGFREVLRIDPQNLSALDGIGLLLFQMGGQPYDPTKFQESRSCFRQHVLLKPKDPEPHYWVGGMDWTLSFHANGELRARYNKRVSGKKQIRNEDPLPADLRGAIFAGVWCHN
jgi:tetratricopeptide (TPR) repeat protein